jgi:hypothetical protein
MIWQAGYDQVPYDWYFNQIDEYLAGGGDSIFVFSDASEVIDVLRQKYGERVHFRAEALMVEGGEGHENLASFGGGRSDRAISEAADRMGRDIIIEAYMMASARKYLHGNSNVANFVRCLNPDLDAYDVFQPIYDSYRPGIVDEG